MGIRVALHHKTIYEYDRLVTLSPQIVRLRPAPHSRTQVSSYSLRVEPQDHFINWQQDPHGNFLARLVFPNQTRYLLAGSGSGGGDGGHQSVRFFPRAGLPEFSISLREPTSSANWRCSWRRRPPVRALKHFWLPSTGARLGSSIFWSALNFRLSREIRYVVRMAPGVQSAEETLELASGSCRDSAWLLVQILRHLGLAARFVSGYLIQLKPDVKAARRPGGSGSGLHRSACLGGSLPARSRMDWSGPDFRTVRRRGTHSAGGNSRPASAARRSQALVSLCEVEFHHEMYVTRIHEDPRVTKPYTEEEWQRICDLGERIDGELTAGDVRLTMGGEPTFVSIDDMDGDEWNTAALGPAKLRLAGELLHRLRDQFAPGGLLHFGQGKWYPGESLPRWALTCYWRTDGIPLWRDPQLIADSRRDYGFGNGEALQFAEALAQRLGGRSRSGHRGL